MPLCFLNSFERRVPQMMRLPTLGLPPYRVFTLEEIDDATNNFDATNLMGEGSQGLQKQLPQNLDQSMEALPKLRHRHLVSLLGHCTVTYQDHPIAARNVFIVLENISNGSLVDHLTGILCLWLSFLKAHIRRTVNGQKQHDC
ncbi:unnamed protein product [Prunus armeniaca]|uniref:Serine-threonine/tyrosine-protein kinase catalytic domain-containing protein n=1 Tax=Prunus armeniaca TaxID=36596 RepID=A0A6J5VWS7_PRUAR|nr:unnamed protein product [Prunus armeniaca]